MHLQMNFELELSVKHRLVDTCTCILLLCFCSYPGCCVLKSPPLVSSSRDSRSVQSSFIADLHSRMPTLCGDAIRYSNKALTPFSNLQTAALSSNYPNIKVASIPGRKTDTPRHSDSHSSVYNTQARGQRLSLIGRASAAMASASSGHVTSHDNHQIQTVPNISTSTNSYSTISSELVTPSMSAAQVTNTRIVPVFKPAHHSSQPRSTPQSGVTSTKSAPLRPVFKPTSATKASTAGNRTLQTVPASEKHTQSNLPQQRRLGHTHTPKDLGPPPTKQARVATQHTPLTGTHTARGGGCLLQHQRRGRGSAEQLVPSLSQIQSHTPSPTTEASHKALKKV